MATKTHDYSLPICHHCCEAVHDLSDEVISRSDPILVGLDDDHESLSWVQHNVDEDEVEIGHGRDQLRRGPEQLR